MHRSGGGGGGGGGGAPHHHEGACPICFRAFDGRITKTITPCGHEFCTACIVEATARSVQGRSCPMCRTLFPAGYMDVPADELTSYLLKVRSRHAQTADRHVVRFSYGNSVLPLKAAQGGSRWCAFLRLEGSATARGRQLTEADYIERCDFVVHHGSRDEHVAVSEPPYELRRNSVSSAAHGENGSRRSASPMLGVMIELRVVWRACCNERPLTLHLAINLQGATHSCSVDFDTAPPPRRAPRAPPQLTEATDRGSLRGGGGSVAARIDAADGGLAAPDAPGQTTQLINELESMRSERTKLLRQKAALEEAAAAAAAVQDSARDGRIVAGPVAVGMAGLSALPRLRTGSAEGGRREDVVPAGAAAAAAAAAAEADGGRRGSGTLLIDDAGRVTGRAAASGAGGGRVSGGGGVSAIGRRLGIGRQLQAAIEASEARDSREAAANAAADATDATNASAGASHGSGRVKASGRRPGSRSSGYGSGGRSRSAPSATHGHLTAKPEPEPEPEPEPAPGRAVVKRSADRARLSRLAQPTVLKHAAEHSAQELADLRRGYARQGLPRQAYADEIVAEHGLTFLGLGGAGAGAGVGALRGPGGEAVGGSGGGVSKEITRMRASLVAATSNTNATALDGSGGGGGGGGWGGSARDEMQMDGSGSGRKRTPSSGRRAGSGKAKGGGRRKDSAAMVSAVSELEIAGGRSLPRAARRFVAEAVQEKALRDEREAFRFH
jgi:hypothetical protein